LAEKFQEIRTGGNIGEWDLAAGCVKRNVADGNR
jgi:hypothetical protein